MGAFSRKKMELPLPIQSIPSKKPKPLLTRKIERMKRKKSGSEFNAGRDFPIITFSISCRNRIYDQLSAEDKRSAAGWVDEQIETLKSWRKEIIADAQSTPDPRLSELPDQISHYGKPHPVAKWVPFLGSYNACIDVAGTRYIIPLSRCAFPLTPTPAPEQ